MAHEVPERVTDRPHEDVALHAGPAFDEVRRAGRETVLGQLGPDHLAHFTGTVCDFVVDLLPGGAAGRIRACCLQAGRQLSGTVVAVDETLREAATGALIRTVLHTDQGAYYCNRIVPGRCVVGTVFERLGPAATEAPLTAQPRIMSCDEAVSKLVTGLRERLSLGTQNPGGFERRSRTAGSGAVLRPHLEHHRDAGERAANAVEAEFLAALDTADLHYVALCRDNTIVQLADCLDHGDVSRFFTQIGVPERRAFYATFNRGLGLLASRFARVVSSTIGTRLLRLVLDVEQGAIYYYRLGPGEYLAGVTLDQARVLDADSKMSTLAIACRRVLRSAHRDG